MSLPKSDAVRPGDDLQMQLCRQVGQGRGEVGLVQDAAGPADPRGHGRVALHQVHAGGSIGGGGMRAGCSPVRT